MWEHWRSVQVLVRPWNNLKQTFFFNDSILQFVRERFTGVSNLSGVINKVAVLVSLQEFV